MNSSRPKHRGCSARTSEGPRLSWKTWPAVRYKGTGHLVSQLRPKRHGRYRFSWRKVTRTTRAFSPSGRTTAACPGPGLGATCGKLRRGLFGKCRPQRPAWPACVGSLPGDPIFDCFRFGWLKPFCMATAATATDSSCIFTHGNSTETIREWRGLFPLNYCITRISIRLRGVSARCSNNSPSRRFRIISIYPG